MTTSILKQRGTRLKTVTACAVAAWALAFGPAFADDKIIVGLITKEYTNPFFVKMKQGAEAKAKELGVDFRSLAGKSDGDNAGQVDAIERLMNAGAKAILMSTIGAHMSEGVPFGSIYRSTFSCQTISLHKLSLSPRTWPRGNAFIKGWKRRSRRISRAQ